MDNDLIYIRTLMGKKKDAFRVNSGLDIPSEYKDIIKVDGDSVIIKTMEGEEIRPLGVVIGYENNGDSEHPVYNAWPIDNASSSLEYKGGCFYKKPSVMVAMRLGDSLPSGISIEEAPKVSGKIGIRTSWGEDVYGDENNSYLMIYGHTNDGGLDANILGVNTNSFNDYYVCDKHGSITMSLKEYDENYKKHLHNL